MDDAINKMENVKSISVCMATYNGEAYVARQVWSILEQLAPDDELIVVDDCSTDGTVETLERIGDSRIVIDAKSTRLAMLSHWQRTISYLCQTRTTSGCRVVLP
jgi:Glycosyl transferase family 2